MDEINEIIENLTKKHGVKFLKKNIKFLKFIILYKIFEKTIFYILFIIFILLVIKFI